jgi:hypothetical protein
MARKERPAHARLRRHRSSRNFTWGRDGNYNERLGPGERMTPRFSLARGSNHQAYAHGPRQGVLCSPGLPGTTSTRGGSWKKSPSSPSSPPRDASHIRGARTLRRRSAEAAAASCAGGGEIFFFFFFFSLSRPHRHSRATKPLARAPSREPSSLQRVNAMRACVRTCVHARSWGFAVVSKCGARSEPSPARRERARLSRARQSACRSGASGRFLRTVRRLAMAVACAASAGAETRRIEKLGLSGEIGKRYKTSGGAEKDCIDDDDEGNGGNGCSSGRGQSRYVTGCAICSCVCVCVCVCVRVLDDARMRRDGLTSRQNARRHVVG